MAPGRRGVKKAYQPKKKRYSDAEKADYYKNMANGLASKLRSNYKKPYKYPGLGRGIGTAMGAGLGGMFGNPAVGGIIGGGVGQAAHSLVKTITGHGDYTVTENSLVYNRDAIPEFSTSNRCTRIKHREFVGDIRGSVNFASSYYDINPSNAMLFPWLSGIASNYEQWVCEGMVFEFKTTSATAVASTNTALGTVIMATQYNTLADNFISKVQMENYEFSQSVVACDSALHAIECNPRMTACQGLFYVNDAGYNENADPRLYNIGRFTLATVGMQAAATIGELWVSYDICFLKPKLQGMSNVFDVWKLDTNDIAVATPFGSFAGLDADSTSFAYEGTPQAATALYTNPWTGSASANRLYINPNYQGNLVVIYTLEVPSGVAYQDPTFSLEGNLNLLNDIIVGPKDYANTDQYISYTIGINCRGGYGSAGTPPAIALTSGNIGASTATYGRLCVFSVAPIIS